ncbi:MAG: SPOR domain-containing protein [Candidatus Rokuibacteriota bacterium]
MRPAPKRGRRLGTLLVLLGCVSLLGSAFAAGLYTGRVGVRPPPKKLLEMDKDAGTTRPRDRSRPTEPQPSLTFYQELTAPLTAPPPAWKGTKPRAAEPAKLVEGPLPAEAPKTDAPLSAPVAAAAPAPDPGGGFTVQVGAYKAADPAEALRATLAAAGWDSRVVAAEVADGVRYRVQVGTYPTRDAARAAAARLAAERSVPTLVTAR